MDHGILFSEMTGKRHKLWITFKKNTSRCLNTQKSRSFPYLNMSLPNYQKSCKISPQDSSNLWLVHLFDKRHKYQWETKTLQGLAGKGRKVKGEKNAVYPRPGVAVLREMLRNSLNKTWKTNVSWGSSILTQGFYTSQRVFHKKPKNTRIFWPIGTAVPGGDFLPSFLYRKIYLRSARHSPRIKLVPPPMYKSSSHCCGYTWLLHG